MMKKKMFEKDEKNLCIKTCKVIHFVAIKVENFSNFKRYKMK